MFTNPTVSVVQAPHVYKPYAMLHPVRDPPGTPRNKPGLSSQPTREPDQKRPQGLLLREKLMRQLFPKPHLVTFLQQMGPARDPVWDPVWDSPGQPQTRPEWSSQPTKNHVKKTSGSIASFCEQADHNRIIFGIHIWGRSCLQTLQLVVQAPHVYKPYAMLDPVRDSLGTPQTRPGLSSQPTRKPDQKRPQGLLLRENLMRQLFPKLIW